MAARVEMGADLKRVVVTGMGITSCLGNTLDDVKDSLYEAKPGIIFNEKYAELRRPICAELERTIGVGKTGRWLGTCVEQPSFRRLSTNVSNSPFNHKPMMAFDD